MNFESLSRKELLEEARKRDITISQGANKAELTRLLNQYELENKEEVELIEKAVIEKAKIEEVSSKEEIGVLQPVETREVEAPAVKPAVLSHPARIWSNYFTKINVSPEDFLRRYPQHKFKPFIEEIIKFNIQKTP